MNVFLDRLATLRIADIIRRGRKKQQRGRMKWYGGYVGNGRHVYQVFRADFVPERSDDLPFAFCAGPYDTQEQLTNHLRRAYTNARIEFTNLVFKKERQ